MNQLQFCNTFSQLGTDFFSRVSPEPLSDPQLVSINPAVCDLLGIETPQQNDFLLWASGNQVIPDSDPLAMVYAGHQFGGYVPQLGDGRGLLLGELQSQGIHWDIHLKGAGKTPYSRFGDGKAVLRSSIREYLASEAMHGLGIPTTRALSICVGSDAVYREAKEQAAMLIRVARTHIRFGSFEYFFHNQQHQQLQALADYVIEHLYPELQAGDYAGLFQQVVTRTAQMIAKWQCVGFCHGVMNTDNMSIYGETLDYGPYGFLETYDPSHICNHSDPSGRYAYNKQPMIGLWNCNALGHALSGLIDRGSLVSTLQSYEPEYLSHYYQGMGNKLGLENISEELRPLVDQLLQLLQEDQVDYSHFFYHCHGLFSESGREHLGGFFNNSEKFNDWIKAYFDHAEKNSLDTKQAQQLMRDSNPKFVLRNYMAEQAIRAACDQNDFSLTDNLMKVLQAPFDEHPDHQEWADTPPDWAASICVSCSS